MTQEPFDEGTRVMITKALELAQLHLLDKGEFYPFGLTLDKEGDLAHFYVNEPEEGTPVGEVYDDMKRRVREKTANDPCKAAAIVSRILIPNDDTDERQTAVRVEVETETGPLHVFGLPYAVDEEKGVDFEDPIAHAQEKELFVAG
ncbi:MAG: hypothetical protein GF419_10315 [Ignavibacteriales bacterium]|nr:hypothetical protein [Ignavibacteriales bacterium]